MDLIDFCFHDKEQRMDYSRPDWMGELSDDLYLSELSIPGTHDSMARFDPALINWLGLKTSICQSLTLDRQLKAGLRAFDIRLYQQKDHFEIWHGMAPTYASFENVMEFFIDFLKAHPSETIIMRAAKSGEENVSSTFGEMFERYILKYEDEDAVWKGYPETGFNVSPRLGDVRGKIVILQDFTAVDSQGENMPLFGVPWNSLKIQDHYNIWLHHGSMNGKWFHIRELIKEAMTDENPQSWYVNFTSGTGLHPWPYPAGLARGHRPGLFSKFCDGMNVRTYEYITKCYTSHHKFPNDPNILNNTEYCAPYLLDQNQQGRLGIIMMDFPGRGLIDAIIAHNGLPRHYGRI